MEPIHHSPQPQTTNNQEDLIEVRGEGNLSQQIAAFRHKRGIQFVLAFSGGADDDHPMLQFLSKKMEHEESPNGVLTRELLDGAKDGYVLDIVEPILHHLKDYWGSSVAILTGGTKWGIPSIVAKTAKEKGFAVIGVFPSRALVKNQALGPETLDLRICVHPLVGESTWGDEAPVFTKLLDAAVVISGGAGTMVEVTHLLKSNEAIVDRFVKESLARGDDMADIAKGVASIPGVKRIIPIRGTGGTADKLQFFPGKTLSMAACLPGYPILTGREAFNYLLQLNDDQLAESTIK